MPIGKICKTDLSKMKRKNEEEEGRRREREIAEALAVGDCQRAANSGKGIGEGKRCGD